MSELLNTQQALEVLSLSNYRYLKYLNQRGLLPRIVLGPRTFRYERDDLEKLLLKSKTKNVLLTTKPSNH